MKKVIGLMFILVSLLCTLQAQQPDITIVPLVQGIPINSVTCKNANTLNSLSHGLKDQTLKMLREFDINPDSCEFISSVENHQYATNIGKQDICYTYCQINYENGKSKQEASIHYNGFVKELKRPKLHVRFLNSDDFQIQRVIVYYYRGLPAQMTYTPATSDNP